MTSIEKIAFDKLRGHIYDAAERIRKDKIEEMTLDSLKHNVFFVQSDIQKMLQTLNAIEENNPTLYPR